MKICTLAGVNWAMSWFPGAYEGCSLSVHCSMQGVAGVHAESDTQDSATAAAKKGKKQRQKAKNEAQQVQQALQAQQPMGQNPPMQEAQQVHEQSQQAQEAHQQSQQAQQSQPPHPTTEQKLTVQQALAVYMLLQHAQQMTPQPTHLLPELKPDFSGDTSGPNTPLSSMRDERQQTTHEHFGTASSEAQCSLLQADHTTASTPHKQPAAGVAPAPSAAPVASADCTVAGTATAGIAHTEADQAPSSTMLTPADVQSMSWAASSPQLMCCPLTQVSPLP